MREGGKEGERERGKAEIRGDKQREDIVGKSLQINGMFYKSCYVMNIIIALPPSLSLLLPLSPSLPPFNEYMNMYWLRLSLPPLPPSPYMYMYKYTCSTCTYLNCITVTRSTPSSNQSVSVSVSVSQGD